MKSILLIIALMNLFNNADGVVTINDVVYDKLNYKVETTELNNIYSGKDLTLSFNTEQKVFNLNMDISEIYNRKEKNNQFQYNLLPAKQYKKLIQDLTKDKMSIIKILDENGEEIPVVTTKKDKKDKKNKKGKNIKPEPNASLASILVKNAQLKNIDMNQDNNGNVFIDICEYEYKKELQCIYILFVLADSTDNTNFYEYMKSVVDGIRTTVIPAINEAKDENVDLATELNNVLTNKSQYTRKQLEILVETYLDYELVVFFGMCEDYWKKTQKNTKKKKNPSEEVKFVATKIKNFLDKKRNGQLPEIS
jgi:hypothetical protein